MSTKLDIELQVGEMSCPTRFAFPYPPSVITESSGLPSTVSTISRPDAWIALHMR